MMLVSRSPTRTGRESDTLLTGLISRLYLPFFNKSSNSRLAWKPSRDASPTDVISRNHVITTMTQQSHITTAVISAQWSVWRCCSAPCPTSYQLHSSSSGHVMHDWRMSMSNIITDSEVPRPEVYNDGRCGCNSKTAPITSATGGSVIFGSV